MQEAIFSLIGVVGGVISFIGQFIINDFDNKRWRKEKLIEHLKSKRSELELKYDKCINSLYESLESGMYNASSLFNTMYLFPNNVKDAYKKATVKGDLNKESIWGVEAEMKKSLAKIDSEIDDQIRDNPPHYWFKRKIWGWGWEPATWQGWSITLLYLGIIALLVITREKYIPGNPDSGSNFLVFGLPFILFTALFIFIAYKKGEKPKWQWGLPEKKD